MTNPKPSAFLQKASLDITEEEEAVLIGLQAEEIRLACEATEAAFQASLDEHATQLAFEKRQREERETKMTLPKGTQATSWPTGSWTSSMWTCVLMKCWPAER